jgi:hypothetical protein
MLFGCSRNSFHDNNNQTSGMRESRSFDKIGLKQHKYDYSNIPCINNDGKYVISSIFRPNIK